jgi:CelD/BcsL family acetyltransferase involved in cellulose biosynthesis
VAWERVPWAELDRRGNRSVFCSRAWLEYLSAEMAVRPVVARVLVDDRPRGWFTGAIARHGGVRLLGAPLPGWGTSYMGVDWDDPADDVLSPVAVAALRRWATFRLRCAHVEVMVRSDPRHFPTPPGTTPGIFHSYQCDLSDDAAMLSAMSTNARRNLRRAERRGVRVEAVSGDASREFVETCHRQLVQAFARRGTRPSAGVQRLYRMVEAVHPSGQLLLLRALDATGRTAATSISVGKEGGTAVFLMGAGEPSLLGDRPNDAVMWAAMRTWRDRGATRFDFGGGGTYKEKFGAQPVNSVWLRSSILPGTEPVRAWLRTAEARRRSLLAGPTGARGDTAGRKG